MSDLIKDKNASSTGSFVMSCFTFYYFISRLGFISLLAFFFYSQALREYSVPGDRYFFCCVHVCYR